ncbi:methyltransferase domain-containing protein [Methylomonas albis]|uniref:Methyltransferase domain-containing protein n=1 Tax=Methylomonas albis TaxID=1854563 RepID=A0ABR9CZ03_9GAMM|nr:methyltransferase domain-containing protein [Methylomonas albis]MBD9355766.1 methyltransferase domain-containing protein [Methylomonas albis]
MPFQNTLSEIKENKLMLDKATCSSLESNLENYYLHARPEVLELVPISARRVLDVGCGAGGFSATLKSRQSVEIHGVELSPRAAETAKLHLDHVWNYSIEDALHEIPEEYYDCIVIADILEHLVDPGTVLASLKRKLAQDGKIVASIPNIQNWGIVSELIQGRWDYCNEGILDRTHLRFFTRKSVEELFWSAGFNINKISRTIHGPLPPRRLTKVLEAEGLSYEALEQDGQTFQFLVEAKRAKNLVATPKVAVIILNWNGKDDTIECLNSVKEIDYLNYNILVVDNGSNDDSLTSIKKLFPDVILIETGHNKGYAGGNNAGIRHALEIGAEYIILLNNDTIVDKLVIKSFIEASAIIDNPSIMGGKIYYYSHPDRLWYAGARWLPSKLDFEHIGLGQKDDPAFDRFSRVDYVTGCLMFIPAEIFHQVGLLDEDFFLTYEETDWCYRAKKLGYESYYIPAAKIWHKVSVSFGGPESPIFEYFMARNRLLWARKHLSLFSRIKLYREYFWIVKSRMIPSFVVADASVPFLKRYVWSLASWLNASKRYYQIPANQAILRGIFDYLFGRFGNCPDSIRSLPRSS